MPRLLLVLMCVTTAWAASLAPVAAAALPEVVVSTPLSPPAWALLERHLLTAHEQACREYFAKYFDERGYLLCVERWGGDDGPDDAIENCNHWPYLHALGAPDVILRLCEQAWEGHLRQYTAAKTVAVPFARDGMYYKEFPVMFDWLHNGEGLTVFNELGLCTPQNPALRTRAQRFAGFYLNEDPGAPNYDARVKIIRSMFNGSRGPLLRKATALDWAGDPIEIENRFRPGHGERSYQEMLDHFKDYNDIVGDHPQNLRATTLAFSAFALTHDEKYRRWLLEYVDAWRQRAADNGGIIPSNIGLDGKIGSAANGKWYGGVYGWGFSVVEPQTGHLVHRNTTAAAFVGLMNAFTLTGDDRYLNVWRTQTDAINAQSRVVEGRRMYPRMYGDEGWYAWNPEPYSDHAAQLYCLSLHADDYARAPKTPWLEFLQGKNPNYPEAALRRDLAELRSRVLGMREDPTTPDTRLADDPAKFNPAAVQGLLELAMGALHPGRGNSILCAAVRYFDRQRRRAGLPEDVAALVTRISATETELTLVNINPLVERTVVVQAGAYGEHEITAVGHEAGDLAVGGRSVRVRLQPGAGGRLTLRVRRFAAPPTLAFPDE